MVDSLKKYNANVKFTIYPNANHNSWDTTYNNDSLYSWFLSQKKIKYKQIFLQQRCKKNIAEFIPTRKMTPLEFELKITS